MSHYSKINKVMNRSELPVPATGYDLDHYTVPECDGCLWFEQRTGEAPIHPGWSVEDILHNCCEGCLGSAWLDENE